MVRTSVETAPADLVAAVQTDWAVAAGFAADGTLHARHVAEWEETVWVGGLPLALPRRPRC